MFTLRVLQAGHGDSFVLVYGTPAAPRHAIIDGGPPDTYERSLGREADRIASTAGAVDFVNVSHVDDDHIVGVLDLFAEMRRRAAEDPQSMLRIPRLWLNSFDATLGPALRSRVMTTLAGVDGALRQESALAVNGIDAGNRLRISALQLGARVNAEFPGGLICVDDAPAPLRFGNLSLRVVGPTRRSLDALKSEWQRWLDERAPDLGSTDPAVLANADTSIPNLSSVMLLARADDATVLFTGDGRSDHLLEGLAAQGLLGDDGTMHVDVLKVMHHGSNRNVTRRFFATVTADRYVISANEHPDNPDLATLGWIVEAARRQGRRIDLFVTNRTRSVRRFEQEYDPEEYGFTLEVMPPHWWYRDFELAP